MPDSQVGAAFEQPLSSGRSIADVTEQALLSVARVFVINEAGLVVTNKHVAGTSDEISAEFVSGNRYRGDVTFIPNPPMDGVRTAEGG